MDKDRSEPAKAAVAGQLERGVRPAVPKRGLVERLRDDAQGEDLGADGMGWSPAPALKREAADEIERLRAALAKANEQAEHFERQWYLRGDAIEAAIPAMRAYARENPRHEYKGATQDPNGVHAWLARNDGPNVRAKQKPTA
ncbi:MAG: hypothetical protein IOD11_00035 [Rhodocyclaceae bacterium]|nr:hypothetical protein [Rhodocyclaceae bacterium]